MSTQATLASFTGDIVTPKDGEEYEQAISRWAKNAKRQAELVVFPKNSGDVSEALKYATEKGLAIAVKGGGHNAAGASSAEGGMVIDLSRYLNEVRIDEGKKLGYVGGGAVWKTVDTEAIKYGLATVGGTVNHTGVGGLTLGGGYGWLSGRHGLAADNLREATIVVADGRVLTVNENSYSDLYWGIRGGGGNFGVVTEFVFELYPQAKTVFAGVLVLDPDALASVSKALDVWWPTAKDNSAMCQILTIGPNGEPAIVLVVFYNGTEAEGRGHFKDFYALDGIVQDSVKVIPFEELNGLQNEMSGYGKGAYLKGVTQKRRDFESMKQILAKLDVISQEGFTPAVIYEYFPLQKINSVPVRATAFRRQLDPNILITFAWEGEEDRSAKARDIVNKIVDDIVGPIEDVPNPDRIGYTNYDTDMTYGGPSTSDVLYNSGNSDRSKAAFGDNYERLQGIKAEFDPNNIFNRWFPITPTEKSS
ncbi:FAD binding domain-containing protein [Coprinopsis sp. MPI-PUGE-AT-0042]|nr:FAD binding domain-containing protein [Coprinopsis sp. MPI-PUGE-AT-0042]